MKKDFTKKQNQVLSEIYRRLNFFHQGDLNTDLLLLARPSEVKEIKEFDLVKPSSREIPRTLNWYNLTEKGKSFFQNYVTKQKLSDKTNHKIFVGSYVKTFNKNFIN